jgi:hypothetical protein
MDAAAAECDRRLEQLRACPGGEELCRPGALAGRLGPAAAEDGAPHAHRACRQDLPQVGSCRGWAGMGPGGGDGAGGRGWDRSSAMDIVIARSQKPAI